MASGGVELDRTVDSIRVGSRLRRDLGDLDELCASIQAVGLLQPITITPDGTLVCGARRLAAVKRLGWQTVKVWVSAMISSRLAEVLAEQHENTVRKPFTPTEAATLYAELKRLYAADAARRQHASRFTSQRNPRRNATIDGDADSAAPSASTANTTLAAGAARRQAARAITGRDSSWSLEHVIEVQRVAEDPSAPKRLREIARRELAAMDADGTINGHYLAVQAAASTDALARLAEDPAQPARVKERAASELDRLDQGQAPLELVRAAQAAIARATTADETSTSVEAGTGSDATGTRRPAAIKRYGLRAFVSTIEEMDGWWRHYDPQEIASGLTEEQWQRFCAYLDGSIAFIHAIAAARGCEMHATDRQSRAACH